MGVENEIRKFLYAGWGSTQMQSHFRGIQEETSEAFGKRLCSCTANKDGKLRNNVSNDSRTLAYTSTPGA